MKTNEKEKLRGVCDEDLSNFVVSDVIEAITLASPVVNLSQLHLHALPHNLNLFPFLLDIDLSHNELVDFPGKWFTLSFPQLQSLHLHCNRLDTLEHILELSQSLYLQNLSIHQNPMRLLHNRIYLLESLFKAPAVPSLDAWPKNIDFSPRAEGFPVLQTLNRKTITPEDIELVQQELGRKVRRYGKKQRPRSAVTRTRMGMARSPINERNSAVKELVRFHTFREKQRSQKTQGFHPDAPPAHIQYEINTNRSSSTPVQASATSATVFALTRVEAAEDEYELEKEEEDECFLNERQMAEVKERLQLGYFVTSSENLGHSIEKHRHSVSHPSRKAFLTNTNIMDNLTSDQRSAVRERSKEKHANSLKGSPFDVKIFTDCIAQVQKSRKLTEDALEALVPDPMKEAPSNFDMGRYEARYGAEASEQQYEMHEKFCRQPIQIENQQLKFEFRTMIQKEHRDLQKRTDSLLARSQSSGILLEEPPIRAELDQSLKRLDLQNHIDFAPQIIRPSTEKRYIQALIDSDRQIVEEEIIQQRLRSHHQRLREIANREKKQHPSKQRKAPSFRRKQSTTEHESARTLPRRQSKDDTGQRLPLYKTIETIESAAAEKLPGVSSREILLRCAEIRRTSRQDLKNLEKAKHKFVEDELEFEKLRTNKLSVLLRRLHRDEQKRSKVLLQE